VSDRPLILAGLTLFVGLVTTPIWHGALDRKTALTAPPIKLPAQEKQCVAPLATCAARTCGCWKIGGTRRCAMAEAVRRI